MKKIKLRPLRLNDIAAAIIVERAAWPPPWPQEYLFTKAHLVSQLETFPEGLIGAFLDNEIVGFVTTEIIHFDFLDTATSWDQITDHGFIRKTHCPDGDTMYGVNLSVHPKVARRGIAERLLFAEGRLAIARNLQRIVLGGRLPKYHKYAGKMTADEYVSAHRLRSGKPLDPELSLYLKAGLKVVKVMPNYIPDPDSLNYGVLLVWENPFHKITRYYKPLGALLSRVAVF